MKNGNLTKPITIQSGKETITIPSDSQVTINVKEKYATWKGMSFDIYKDEYILTV